MSYFDNLDFQCSSIPKREHNFWPSILKWRKTKNIFMAIFIVLWPYLSTRKLRCLQKNNIGHTTIGVCTSAAEVWLKYDPDLYFYLEIAQYYAHWYLNKQSKYTVCYRVVVALAGSLIERSLFWHYRINNFGSSMADDDYQRAPFLPMQGWRKVQKIGGAGLHDSLQILCLFSFYQISFVASLLTSLGSSIL